ncbi:unnamed protein product [Lactuca saligna]|uniref:F-box domain-containing protein n=1 Tax=Lactuca saligna TaxID=75948 RepID=A0AA35YQW3_LACSI|nr:unnamed protein product [Lactuca saligna]
MEASASSKIQSRNQTKSLTHMPFEVMEKIIVDLAKISAIEAFRMKSVCRFFNEAGKTDEVYKHMELDGLQFRVWSDQKHEVVNKCIEMRNPNILFRNGLLFFLEAKHEGKKMLEEASVLGNLDSTFVLGMMLMAEGRHRKQEALNMLNNAYRRAKGKWNLRATCSTVHVHLNRERGKYVHFHGFHRSCALQNSVISVSDAFVNGYRWVFMCEICLWDACFIRMSNTRSFRSLDDLPLELLSRISVVLGSESAKDIVLKDFGGDPQVYRTTCIDMFEGMGPKNLEANLFIRTCALHNNIEAMFRQGIICVVSDDCFYYDNFDFGMTLLRQATNEDHLEAIYLLGMIYISRGPHQRDKGLQLLDAYFGWVVSDDGECTGVVDRAKELLQAVDVVHRLTTNNITFQCEDPCHSVKGSLAIGHEEDEDRQRYCTVCHWYLEYGRFGIFLKTING